MFVWLMAAVILMAIGAVLIAYAKKNDRSENYDILIPFFFGLVAEVVGVLILIVLAAIWGFNHVAISVT